MSKTWSLPHQKIPVAVGEKSTAEDRMTIAESRGGSRKDALFALDQLGRQHLPTQEWETTPLLP